MKRKLTAEDARAYVARWQRVNDDEIAALRATSPQDKLRQAEAMYLLAVDFGWIEALASEAEEVRAIWRKLRSRHRG